MSLLSKLFGYTSVNVAGAHRMIADGAILVDVRSDREFADGHAPPAQHIPLNTLTSQIGNLAHGTPIVTICHSGVRSAHAARLLTSKGFQVASIRGGMIAWKRSGGPVVETS
ncbi:MAG: rhodanese-like domain-containing protein [Pseudolysinimonas sp.]